MGWVYNHQPVSKKSKAYWLLEKGARMLGKDVMNVMCTAREDGVLLDVPAAKSLPWNICWPIEFGDDHHNCDGFLMIQPTSIYKQFTTKHTYVQIYIYICNYIYIYVYVYTIHMYIYIYIYIDITYIHRNLWTLRCLFSILFSKRSQATCRFSRSPEVEPHWFR